MCLNRSTVFFPLCIWINAWFNVLALPSVTRADNSSINWMASLGLFTTIKIIYKTKVINLFVVNKGYQRTDTLPNFISTFIQITTTAQKYKNFGKDKLIPEILIYWQLGSCHYMKTQVYNAFHNLGSVLYIPIKLLGAILYINIMHT